MNWISVEDRLPENDDEVLVCQKTEGYDMVPQICIYNSGKWICLFRGELINPKEWLLLPTHWMPLPEPPKTD